MAIAVVEEAFWQLMSWLVLCLGLLVAVSLADSIICQRAFPVLPSFPRLQQTSSMICLKMIRLYPIFSLCGFINLVHSSPTQRATTNCFPLISSNQQDDFPSGNLPCVAIPENTVTQGNLKVLTYHWLEGPDTAVVYGDNATLHLKNTNDGIQKAVKTYADFLEDTPLTTNLVLVSEGSIDDWGITGRRVGTTSAQRSFSVLVRDWKAGYTPDKNKWARTTAHELFHCVLRSTNAEASKDAESWSSWWKEGGAAFFGSALFPEPQDPAISVYHDSWYPDLHIQGWWQTYDPTEPLYEQKYAASLFFLDMWTQPKAVRQDLKNIHAYLSHQVVTSTIQAERSRMAADSFTADHFKTFAQRYVDGTIKERRDSDVKAVLLAPYTQGYRDRKTVQLAATAAPSRWTASMLVSFGFVRLDLTLKAPDSTNQITYAISTESQGVKTTVFYRLKTAKNWKTLPDASSKEVKVGCGAGPQEYILLIVSTDGTTPTIPVVKVAPKSSKQCP